MKTYTALILFFCLILLSCSNNNNNNNAFYNKVLSDFNKSSDFIALNVKTRDYNGRVLIQNLDLYNYLHSVRGLDTSSYRTDMEKILARRRTLRLNSSDFLKWKFIKVKEMTNVYLNANKGINSFLEYYFDGTVFKYAVSLDEMNAVINQLFYWQVAVKFDGITGQLILDK